MRNRNVRYTSARSVEVLKSISVGAIAKPLAEKHVLDALFTTITRRLEPGGRGTRFPLLMDHLYWGRLQPAQARDALRELAEVEDDLRNTPLRDIIWNPLDSRPHDDAHEPVNRHAENVLEYFTDVNDRPLIARLRDSVEECRLTGQQLRITLIPSPSRELPAGITTASFGAAWMAFGRTVVPRWKLYRSYNSHSAIPVWTFGMDFVMIGGALMIAGVSPATRAWFSTRPVLLFALILAAIVGWLAVCYKAGFLSD